MQMLAALGTRAPQLTLQQARPARLPRAPTSRHSMLSVPADEPEPGDGHQPRPGRNQPGCQPDDAALGAYNANPYAGAAAAPPPAAEAQGAALQATAGGAPGGAERRQRCRRSRGHRRGRSGDSGVQRPAQGARGELRPGAELSPQPGADGPPSRHATSSGHRTLGSPGRSAMARTQGSSSGDSRTPSVATRTA